MLCQGTNKNVFHQAWCADLSEIGITNMAARLHFYSNYNVQSLELSCQCRINFLFVREGRSSLYLRQS